MERIERVGRLGRVERIERVVERAMREPRAFAGAGDLAVAAGMTAPELEPLLLRHYHTTASHLLERGRARAATRLLLQSDRPVPAIGTAAGFSDARSFDEALRRRTGLGARSYRRLKGSREFVLSLPDDFRTDDLLRFHGRDPQSPTDRVRRRRLVRAIRAGGRPGLLTMEFGRRRVRCRLDGRLRPGAARMAEVHRIAWRLLGLDLDPGEFERRARRIPRLGIEVRRRRGLRIPQTPSVFEGLVWGILGQQINLRFAFTLRRRVIDLCGDHLEGGFVAHPTPEALARLDYSDLTTRQFSRRKAEYLIDTARCIASGGLEIEELPDWPAPRVESRLNAIRGIGPWTTHYVMMRSCGFGDCVPIGDSGLVTALARLYRLKSRPGPERTDRLMRPFAPHRSLATFHFWMTLGGPA